MNFQNESQIWNRLKVYAIKTWNKKVIWWAFEQQLREN